MLAGCPEKLSTVEDPERLGDATAAETALIRTRCEAYEACAAEYGRVWATADDCIDAQLEALDADLEIGGRHAGDSDAEACARAVTGVACNRLHLLADVWETDIACVAVARDWDAHLIGEVPAGGACTGAPDACEPGTECERDDTGGPRCRRCGDRAQLGEDCTTTGCDASLWCDTEVQPIAACAPFDGKPCSTGTECGPADAYICDPEAQVCRKRIEGDPCPGAGGTGNRCNADDPRLVCIGASCAQRSGVEAPCDDADDCSSFDMACVAGTCRAGAGRDDACSHDDACKGFLVCRGDVCTDRPGRGEPCQGECRPPLDCVNFVCRDLPDELPEVGLGEPCRAICGDGCTVGVATCSVGWCAPAGSNLPSTCESFLGLDEACLTPADTIDGVDGCDPATSYCRAPDPPNGECAAYASIGADCSARACNPAEAYCDVSVASPTCTALTPIGGACVDAATCAGGRCLGSCTGGAYDGLPCRSAGECGSGSVCNGQCSGEDLTWTGCAP
jgi:hypothetical protein